VCLTHRQNGEVRQVSNVASDVTQIVS